MTAKNPARSADIEIGRRVQMLRRKAGVSLISLAENVGISAQKLRSCEMGTVYFSAGVLQKIAHTLRVDIREFFPKLEPHASNQCQTMQARTEILSGMSDIKCPEQLNVILRLVRRMQDSV